MTLPGQPPATDPATVNGIPTDENGAPIFGRSTAPLVYETFHLEVTPDGGSPYLESFQAHVEGDAGSIMDLLSARTKLAQGMATARLIGGILRNDDGVPAEWRPKADEGTGLLLPEADEDGYVLKDDEDRPLYRDHAGDLVTDPALVQPEHEAGSSRRRFAAVLDDPSKRVRLEALSEIAQWVVTRSGSRPTRRQQRSTTTTPPAGRGSKGKRR